LTGWNTEIAGIDTPESVKAFRYVIEDNKPPVPPGTGLFVYNPPVAGRAFYAVTAVVGGTENTTTSNANSTADGVQESTGPGVPVLQRVAEPETAYYIARPKLYYYTRWETSPTTNSPGQPFDYLVGIPPKVLTPAPVGIHMHAYGGNLEGYFGWWFNGESGAILVSSTGVPYDW
jgi:hypothetical protein